MWCRGCVTRLVDCTATTGELLPTSAQTGWIPRGRSCLLVAWKRSFGRSSNPLTTATSMIWIRFEEMLARRHLLRQVLPAWLPSVLLPSSTTNVSVCDVFR